MKHRVNAKHSGSVLLASLYPQRIASTRLRLIFLKDPLQQAGYPVKVWSFFTDSQMDAWLKGGLSRVRVLLAAAIQALTFISVSRNVRIAIVQRELLPFNSLMLEKLLKLRQVPLIWDVDDGLWQSTSRLKSSIRGSHRKYRWLATNCAEIWAGNRSILDWVGSTSIPAIWVPTVVPSPRKDASYNSLHERDLLVWIGTPSTAPFIQKLIDDLGTALFGWQLLVVGASISAPSGVPVECRPWTTENEADALKRGWVGLYPLDINHPATPYKSSLKSVLFRSHGIPVIVTPTRSTLDTMTNAVGGLFASDPADWVSALAKLQDPRFYAQQVNLSLQSAQEFSSQRWMPILMSRIKRIHHAHHRQT